MSELLSPIYPSCVAAGKHLVNDPHDNNRIFLSFISDEKRLLISNVQNVVASYCNKMDEKEAVTFNINKIFLYGIEKQEYLQVLKKMINLCDVTDDTYEILYEFDNFIQ